MGINSKSVHDIIQTVNDRIDKCNGIINSKTVGIVKEALKVISKMEIIDPIDQKEMVTLASRISPLSQIKEIPINSTLLHKEIQSLAFRFIKIIPMPKEMKESLSQDVKDSLSLDCLSKAHLTLNQAKKIEEEFLKTPQKRARALPTENPRSTKDVAELTVHQQKPPQSGLEALARECPSLYNNPFEVLRNLKNYPNIDHATLLAVCTLAAKRETGAAELSRCIKDYGITDEKVLIEIAKIAAAKDAGTGKVSFYIKNYGITDQKALIEIAEIAMAQDEGPGKTSRYIKNYGITDQKALIKLAKIAATQNSENLPFYIQNFGITDEKALIEIAKIAVVQGGHGVSANIQSFGITDEKVLIEIAKIAAAQDDSQVSAYIQNFGITDEKALIEIAKIAAAQDGSQISAYIQNFGITDEKTLIEIAKIAIRANPRISLDNFNLDKSTSEYKNLLLKCLFLGFESKKGGPAQATASRPELAPFLIGVDIDLLNLKKEDEYIDLLTPSIKTIGKKVITEILGEGSDRIEILDKIANYRNGSIATSLAVVFLEEISSSNDYNLSYQSIASEKTKGSKSSSLLAPRMLPAILLAKWAEKAKHEALLTSKEETSVISGLTSFLQEKRSDLKNRDHPLLQTYLQTEIALDAVEGLSSTRKLQLLSAACKSSEYIKCFGLIQSLCSKKEVEELNNCPLENPIKELENAADRSLARDQFIDLSGIENLYEKYKESFGNCRVPMALETYTRGIRSLADENVRNSLEWFERSVLTKTFKSERNDVDKNPHLKKIQEYDQTNGKNTLKLWQDLVLEISITKASSPEQSSSSETAQLCTGWEDLFLSGTEVSGSCQRVDGDRSLNKCLLAYCMDGKNSMIAVKGADGKILARSMLRLLWDQTDSKPVLFLDMMYPKPCSKERENAIRIAASSCAKELDLKLFTHGGEGLPVVNSIESFGSSCHYEYSDANNSTMPNGKFCISGLSEVKTS